MRKLDFMEEREYWDERNGLGVLIKDIKPGEYVSLLINRNAELYGEPNDGQLVNEELLVPIPENSGLASLLQKLESEPGWRRSEIINEVFTILFPNWYDPTLNCNDAYGFMKIKV